jgi:hypothetical protein
MSDFVMTQSEELIMSQRKVIEQLHETITLRDLLITELKKKLEEKT